MLLTEYLNANIHDDLRSFLDKFLEDVKLSDDRYKTLKNRLCYHMKNTECFRIIYSYKNIYNILYKSVCLMGPENIQTYKECIPNISDVLAFCTNDEKFVKTVLKENSYCMQYIINFQVLEDALINNYSFKVLKIIINELEKDLSTNDQIIDFFSSKNHFNKSLLFFVNGKCLTELLDYLKLKINSNEKLELLLLQRDDEDQLFIHNGKCVESSIRWIKSNMSEIFLNKFIDLIYPSLIDKIEKEDEFLFFLKLIENPCQELLTHAVTNEFSVAVDRLLTTITIENVEDVVSLALQQTSTKIASKIIKFCKNNFSNYLKFEFINLSIEELDQLFSDENFENYSIKLKEYVQQIGLFGILLRVVYQRILKEFKEIEYFGEEEESDKMRYKTEVEDDLLIELKMLSNNETELNDVLRKLHVSNDMSHILYKIEIKKSECYLMKIFEKFLDSNLKKYFWNLNNFVQVCCEAFENKINVSVSIVFSILY